jgi:hypothetical protein
MQDKRIIILVRARGPFEHPPQARKQHRSGTGWPPIAPSGCAGLGGCVTATARSFVSPPELRSERGPEGRSTTPSLRLRTQNTQSFQTSRGLHVIFTRIYFQQNTDEQTSCVWLGRLSATAGWLPTSVRAATEPARFVSRRARRAGPCFSSRTESPMPEQLPRRGPRKPISLLKIVFCPRTLAINAHTRVSITRGEKDGTR